MGAVGGVFKICRHARTYFREDEDAMLPDLQRQCPHTPIAPGEFERRLVRTFLYGQDESPSKAGRRASEDRHGRSAALSFFTHETSRPHTTHACRWRWSY